MEKSVSLRGPAFLIAGMCLALLMFTSGPANAGVMEKAAQKCVNSINKGAQGVARALGKDTVACIKDGGRESLSGTIEECITFDPEGRVAEAISLLIFSHSRWTGLSREGQVDSTAKGAG